LSLFKRKETTKGKSEAVILRTDKYTGRKKRDNKGEIGGRNSKDRQVYWPKEKRQQRRNLKPLSLFFWPVYLSVLRITASDFSFVVSFLSASILVCL
jgi:hypothetical protein